MSEKNGSPEKRHQPNHSRKQFLSNCLTALAINPYMGVRELCGALETSRSTFYRHVAGCDALIAELTDDALIVMENATGYLGRKNARAGLAMAFDACVDCDSESAFLFHRAWNGTELSKTLADILKPFINMSKQNEEVDPSIPNSWIVLSFGSTLQFLSDSDNIAQDAILARRFLFQGFSSDKV